MPPRDTAHYYHSFLSRTKEESTVIAGRGVFSWYYGDLDVEAEVHDVAVLHDVLFAFDREFAGVADSRLSAESHIVIILDDFGADKAFFEVGVDDAGTFRSL